MKRRTRQDGNVTRRDILTLGAAGLLPSWAFAQSTRRPIKIAWFSGGTMVDQKAYVDAFRGGLRELGYAEGRDFRIEYFWRGETIKPFGWLAKDVVASQPDVIMATCEVTAEAAQKVTKTIPIVLTAATDPVAAGIVPNLARPGGNVTGISSTLIDVSVKRVELLKELLPAANKVAFVQWRYEKVGSQELQVVERAATTLGLSYQRFQAEDEGDFTRVFAEIQKGRFSGALDFAGLAVSFPYMDLFPELALKYRVPMVFFMRELVERGGLISYGPSVPDGFRRSATYVDRIAKGARPGDLSIEQPTQWEMCVNVKAASALGIKVPDTILVRADQVIR